MRTAQQERAKEEARRDAEERARAAAQLAADERRRAEDRVLLAEESRSGRCTQGHFAQLQRVLHDVKIIFDSMREGSSWWRLVNHDIVPATEQGTSLKLSARTPGEYHVFAIGLAPVALDITDKRHNEMSLRSPYGPGLSSFGAPRDIDSRVVPANALEDLDMKVHGVGCTLVMAFEKH